MSDSESVTFNDEFNQDFVMWLVDILKPRLKRFNKKTLTFFMDNGFILQVE